MLPPRALLAGSALIHFVADWQAGARGQGPERNRLGAPAGGLSLVSRASARPSTRQQPSPRPATGIGLVWPIGLFRVLMKVAHDTFSATISATIRGSGKGE